MKVFEVGIGFTQEHEMPKLTYGLVVLLKTIWPLQSMGVLIGKLPPLLRAEVVSKKMDSPVRGKTYDAIIVDEVGPHQTQ